MNLHLAWLSRLVGSLWRRPRFGAGPDHALRLPCDPRASHAGEETYRRWRAEWTCPAMHGRGRSARACGFSKTPERETCGRPKCVAWAKRREKREAGKVLRINRRAS